jgi:hypothetical protein
MNVRFRGINSWSDFTTNSKGPDAAHVTAFPFRDQLRASSFFWLVYQLALAVRAPVIRGRPFQLSPARVAKSVLQVARVWE